MDSKGFGWLRAGLGVAVVALPLGLAGCSGIDLGDNPSRDVRKETGPLTVPPPGVQKGTDF